MQEKWKLEMFVLPWFIWHDAMSWLMAGTSLQSSQQNVEQKCQTQIVIAY
jgi:hypothetical protein